MESLQAAREMGLNEQEYQQILDTLKREPTLTELGMFSVMWSEHCGYKYSRPVLALFKTYKEAQETGALENAGVIPLDDELGIVFKIESHNHPSAVEPFQGAATGVGGILRDIFTMGARPIANLNSLRFGPLENPRNRYLFEHAVAGIGHYGNCLIGSERFIWRDKSGVHFDTIGNFVEGRIAMSAEQSALKEIACIETLSIDPETLCNVWKPVRRVFKRATKQLVRISAGLGRTLTVTPDHPVMLRENDTWRVCPAQQVKKGDSIPILLKMPIPSEQNERENISSFDLINIAQRHASLSEKTFVGLPPDFSVTPELRTALRQIEPKADRRCDYLKNGRFPLNHFLHLEKEIGIDRKEIALFRVGKANHMNAVIRPDAHFARLLGYYLSEGCVSQCGKAFKIIFTFALHECEYVKDVAQCLQRLGLRACIEQRKSTIAIHATSWLLGGLLSDIWKCGKGAKEKAIPAFVFDWPENLQYEVLKGLLRGDGSLTTLCKGSHAKITFASSSRTLFEQTLALLQNKGIVPSMYCRAAGKTQIEGRAFNTAPLWILEVNNVQGLTLLSDLFGEERNAKLAEALAKYQGDRYSFPRFKAMNDLAFVKVLSVETSDVEETAVYDVEVDDTHLFVTSNSIITHNCVGVPTVAGEVYFHDCYSGNPLVNAMSVGIVERKKIASAAAKGVGNPVIYVGSATGKDGIHGATFASAELNEDSESKRPNVQMGDPFMEKLLIEATLEALATGFIVGIQDMGAAGLTCSTCEMAAKANLGMEIDVRKVPLRESNMTAYEIMLSESQERMLCVAQRGTENRVMDVFKKWGLSAAVIGEVTADGLTRIKDNGVTVAQIPSKALTDECPTYYLETEEPDYIKELQAFDFATLPEPETLNDFEIENKISLLKNKLPINSADLAALRNSIRESQNPEKQIVASGASHLDAIAEAIQAKIDAALEQFNFDAPFFSNTYTDCMIRLLDSPSIASKRWVTDQYDSMVQTQTVFLPGSDAAVLRIHGSPKGIAVKIDGNGRYGYLDPFVGGQIAVAEAARNVACVGARPVGVTDNLNFANPEKPAGFWQFRRSVEGIAAATEAFGTPVVSGNVSFYNETPDGPIFPTPTIGILGILDDVNKRCQAAFRPDGEGDTIVLLTAYDDPTGGLGGSEYLSVVHGIEAGVPPLLDLDGEKRLQNLLIDCIGEGLFANCHDVSDGGLAVCLAECSMHGRQGALVLMNPADFDAELPPSAHLFGEAQGRVVVTVRNEKQFAKLKEKAAALNIKTAWIGTVGGENLRIALGPQILLEIPVSTLSEIYENAIPRRMKSTLPIEIEQESASAK